MEKIAIDDTWTYGCDKCIVCDQYCKHSRIWWGETQEETEKGIYLLKEKISHPACLKIMNDIKKKRQELVELEYKLFEKQFFIDLANHK